MFSWFCPCSQSQWGARLQMEPNFLKSTKLLADRDVKHFEQTKRASGNRTRQKIKRRPLTQAKAFSFYTSVELKSLSLPLLAPPHICVKFRTD